MQRKWNWENNRKEAGSWDAFVHDKTAPGFILAIEGKAFESKNWGSYLHNTVQGMQMFPS
jgi:hypothetical protein